MMYTFRSLLFSRVKECTQGSNLIVPRLGGQIIFVDEALPKSLCPVSSENIHIQEGLCCSTSTK